MPRDTDESFAAFAVHAMPRLRRLAFAWCRDWHRADDLVQDTLERVCAAWGRVRRNDGEAFAYARTTMLRRLVSDERRSWRRREVPASTAGDPDPATIGVDSALSLDLLNALTSLPPRQRAVVLLRYVEDLSVADVADTLGCSEGTVKSQAHHARTNLQAHLGASYPTPMSRTPTHPGQTPARTLQGGRP